MVTSSTDIASEKRGEGRKKEISLQFLLHITGPSLLPPGPSFYMLAFRAQVILLSCHIIIYSIMASLPEYKVHELRSSGPILFHRFKVHKSYIMHAEIMSVWIGRCIHTCMYECMQTCVHEWMYAWVGRYMDESEQVQTGSNWMVFLLSSAPCDYIGSAPWSLPKGP